MHCPLGFHESCVSNAHLQNIGVASPFLVPKQSVTLVSIKYHGQVLDSDSK